MQSFKYFQLLGWLFATVFVGNAAMAQDMDSLKAGVVKITTKTGQVGTGFIVRVEPEMVYIITAAHVIAGDQQPTVAFFSKDLVPGGQGSAKGAVLPGAQVNDDLRGLAVVIVRGKEQRPSVVSGLVFESSAQLVSGGEQALIIGHPGGGGDWAVVKRDISNRVVHDITLDPGVASRFSGGPILVEGKVVGMVMTNRGEFGLGITHKSLLSYLEGIGIEPKASDQPTRGGFRIVPDKPSDHASAINMGKEPGSFIPIPKESTVGSSSKVPNTKTGKDGAPMVLVPAGEFTMGSPFAAFASLNEQPQHVVYMENFYIDQYEVTVERYQRFMSETHQTAPDYWNQVVLKRDEQKPVVGINWQNAHDYCQWAGKRLPTEAEWEKAARGKEYRTYPWGESLANSNKANYGNKWTLPIYADLLKNVGSYEQGSSPYGVYDMAGNVFEWVEDWYAEEYYQDSPRDAPPGPKSGESKVLRGGSWLSPPGGLLLARREGKDPSERNADVGVRCAQDAP